MSATARNTNLDGATLNETVAYGSDAPSGRADAEPATATAPRGGRYVFNSGARPLEGYTIKRAIGRGGFGEVYYATSDAGKEVALKLITRNLDIERRGVIQCMNLKSPHLITVYDLKESDEGDAFVIMEYVAGPSLAHILAEHPRGLPLAEVRSWLRGLVEGVAYLHDHGIVHRDLKPANLFLEEGVVKIGDYGLSKAISPSQEPGHSESVGTCHYMAPEIGTGKYHKPIDVYAMGVILFEMITGRVPFDGESVHEVLMKHLTARPDLSPLPEPYRSIVARALAKDPNHRPADVRELLLAEDRAALRPAPPEEVFRIENEEEIHRIGMDEPVHYIGPDTAPPPRPRFRPQPQPRRPAPARVARVVRPAAPRQAPAPRPAAPPEPPPPLPSPRVRLAELAGSMLWATPAAFLSAALILPGSRLAGDDLPQTPQAFFFLFGLTLLATWGVLVPTKCWEGRAAAPSTRRLVLALVGLVVGILGAALGEWTRNPLADGFDARLASWTVPGLSRDLGADVLFASYFALAFGATSWRTFTARDRRRRFRFLPVLLTAAVAGLIGTLWPSPQPAGLVVVATTAALAQLVSPWSRAAADHARATRRGACAA